MSDISNGVQALINRMESNPEEFYNPKENDKWAFIYKETFRDVMTEPEKAAIHTALKSVRRKEFEHLVMKEILRVDEDKQKELEYKRKETRKNLFDSPAIAREGEPIQYRFTESEYRVASNLGLDIADYVKMKQQMGI